MELEEIKLFLRIDDDDDDLFLQLAYEAAKEYVIEAVGVCDETKARVKLLLLNLIADFYENRSLLNSKNNNQLRHTIRTLVMQLQLEEE